MNTVEPIRNIEIVKSMGRYLQNRNERDYIMFLIGIYSGLRISDILKLKVRDVRGKSQIVLRENKTGKDKRFPVNPYLKKELKLYLDHKDLTANDCLIMSRQGTNKPLTRVRAWQILNEAADEFGLELIGTHTLRKTFGYHHYKQTKDVATLQKILNHKSQLETLIYIGVNQETINSTINSLKIF